MHRLFGTAKPKVPAPTLDDASASMDKRGSSIDSRVAKLDDELLKYKQQMSKMRDGPAKQQLQRRAINVLKQKKMYQQQRDTIYNQQFNIDQTKFAMDSASDTQLQIAAMKDANTSLKKQMKNIKIDDVENLHDDLDDLFEDQNEINDILGRSYGVPEELDETDLQSELDALGDELLDDTSLTETTPITASTNVAVPVHQSTNTITTAQQQNIPAARTADPTSNLSGLPAAPNRSIAQPSTATRQTVTEDAFNLPAPSTRKLGA